MVLRDLKEESSSMFDDSSGNPEQMTLVAISQDHRHNLHRQQQPKRKTLHNRPLDTCPFTDEGQDVSQWLEAVPGSERSPGPREISQECPKTGRISEGIRRFGGGVRPYPRDACGAFKICLTQEAVAELMRATKRAVSRLESAGKHAPSLTTLKKHAQAVGCRLEIKLVPDPCRNR